MSLSMYDVSIPAFVRALENLSAIFHKAETYAEAKKIEPSTLINARLAPDMFPLARQVQIATDTAKGCAARLAGVEIPVFVDNETTFLQLQERLSKTILFLKSFQASQIENSENHTITLKFKEEMKFSGQQYLLHFALPNFYFHITTAYDILRHNGLEIGKLDYLGGKR